MRIEVGGDPSDEEVAAIVAAVEATWPRTVHLPAPVDDRPVWRFSGRSWHTEKRWPPQPF